MKKTDLSDNQLKTRPAFPVLVTYPLEIVAMVLMWSFLLSYPWEPVSADAAKIIGITQVTGGLIVLYCFCLPTDKGSLNRLPLWIVSLPYLPPAVPASSFTSCVSELSLPGVGYMQTTPAIQDGQGCRNTEGHDDRHYLIQGF